VTKLIVAFRYFSNVPNKPENEKVLFSRLKLWLPPRLLTHQIEQNFNLTLFSFYTSMLYIYFLILIFNFVFVVSF
jgi:hypothetical protein